MFPSVCVRAEGIEETNDLDLWALEDIVRALEGDWALFVPSFQWRDLLAQARSGKGFDWRAVITGLTRYFFREVVVGSRLLGQLLVMVVFTAFCHVRT